MAFQTALSGLNAAQANLGVTGNNIANASTTGFKKSRAEFADIYASTFGGSGSTAIGSGVRLSGVKQEFTQGNVEFTESALDLALSGQGFFVVKDGEGDLVYTRAGAFGVDREGNVVNSHGHKLQSYAVDANGDVTNFTASDLKLDTGTNPANATDTIDINLNLDASSSIPAAAFDVNNPLPDQYTFSTSTTVYDSVGTPHTATMYFRKSAPNQWQTYMAVGTPSAANPATAGTDLFFNSDGSLDTTATTLPVQFFGGAGAGTYVTTTGSDPLGFDIDLSSTTQYAGESAVNSLVQNGYTTGRLSGFDVDKNGIVFARYTNGQSATLGAVALADFANPHALQQVGDTTWAQSFDSGDAVAGQAGKGVFGQIQSGALESSNVDLSKQLVNMIVAQRDFQANAKMISTEDQVTQTIINIR